MWPQRGVGNESYIQGLKVWSQREVGNESCHREGLEMNHVATGIESVPTERDWK